jgi:hypothetical protein
LREQCGVPLKAGISESEQPSIARQRLRNHISCIIVWVTIKHVRMTMYTQEVDFLGSELLRQLHDNS